MKTYHKDEANQLADIEDEDMPGIGEEDSGSVEDCDYANPIRKKDLKLPVWRD